MALLSIRAVTKLDPSHKYFVCAYFLPEQPFSDEQMGEIFSYITVLRSCNERGEAVKYAQHVMETTGHRGVIVIEGSHWTPLSTRFQPLRDSEIALPNTLTEEVKRKQKKAQEQEKIRKELINEAEAKLQRENDKSSLPFFARTLYEHIKTNDRITELKREFVYMEELQLEQSKLLAEHKALYPQHKDEVGEYLDNEFGANFSELAKQYL